MCPNASLVTDLVLVPSRLTLDPLPFLAQGSTQGGRILSLRNWAQLNHCLHSAPSRGSKYLLVCKILLHAMFFS